MSEPRRSSLCLRLSGYGMVELVPFYGDTAWPAHTGDLLDDTRARPSANGHPWIIGGDFSVTDEDVESWICARGSWAQVVRFGLTCRSNEGWSPIDDLVARPDVVAAI